MIVTDQIGHTLELKKYPQRIVSLVPSQTELLYDLGLYNKVTGITKFCIHPEIWYKTKTHVGGTKKINRKKIHELNPDLLIANKEENTKEDIQYLQELYPVYTTDIYSLNDALYMISQIGEITQTELAATRLIKSIEQAFASIPLIKHKQKAIYLIWRKPYMAAGKNTFINQMMGYAGFDNCVEKNRYPELSLNEIITLNPEYILLSSEPYPFSYKHIEELKAYLPQCNILLVNGEMFSWYGSRLVKAAEYFKKLNERFL